MNVASQPDHVQTVFCYHSHAVRGVLRAASQASLKTWRMADGSALHRCG